MNDSDNDVTVHVGTLYTSLFVNPTISIFDMRLATKAQSIGVSSASAGAAGHFDLCISYHWSEITAWNVELFKYRA